MLQRAPSRLLPRLQRRQILLQIIIFDNGSHSCQHIFQLVSYRRLAGSRSTAEEQNEHHVGETRKFGRKLQLLMTSSFDFSTNHFSCRLYATSVDLESKEAPDASLGFTLDGSCDSLIDVSNFFVTHSFAKSIENFHLPLPRHEELTSSRAEHDLPFSLCRTPRKRPRLRCIR